MDLAAAADEQENELIALQSIYEDDFVQQPPVRVACGVRAVELPPSHVVRACWVE